jgi:hypothetical protein
MKASELNWSQIRRFSPREWPPGVLEQMNASVIRELANVRSRLPADHTMTPSPLIAAHVRPQGTSRHSIQGGTRLSDATDIFMHWNTVWRAWLEAMRNPAVGGLGIYLDTVLHGASRPMLHFDTRPERVVWVRYRPTANSSPVYVYHHSQPVHFHRVLGENGAAA